MPTFKLYCISIINSITLLKEWSHSSFVNDFVVVSNEQTLWKGSKRLAHTITHEIYEHRDIRVTFSQHSGCIYSLLQAGVLFDIVLGILGKKVENR